MKKNGNKSCRDFERNDRVRLTREFINGGRTPSTRRIYPKGTKGIVLERGKYTVSVKMDDPPGVDYARKEIDAPIDDIEHDEPT